jgi:AcrR family transcriptional regulator
VVATPHDIDRSPPKQAIPKQDRARDTYERLLNVAGELLAEVGIDRITTNLICARAGVTPPALYRYFKDKYAVLEALGTRLMDRQNRVLVDWIARHEGGGVEAMQGAIEELLRETAATTAAEPGAIWILRALRASPLLIHIRVDSHRYVTDRLRDAYAAHLPNVRREDLWERLRLSVEMGFALDEMLCEEPGVAPDAAFQHAARMLRGSPLPRS